MSAAAARPRRRVAVVIRTYRRNEPLRQLLDRLLDEAADTPWVELAVGVADDGPDNMARDLVTSYADRFEGGVEYRNTASGNISTARNAAIEAGLALGAEWLCFVDDDCLPRPGWFERLFEVQERTGADLVTGPIHDIAPAGAPAWITEQPFLNMIAPYTDGEEPPYGTTANVLIRADWLRQHPDVRFRQELGRLGGEDMVWFETARAAGIVHRYSLHAVVTEQVPLSRTGYRYQLRNKLWFGNTMYVTNLAGGTSANRLVLRGAKHLVRAVAGPFSRLARREPAQWRWALADACTGVGMVSGRFGARLNHH